MLNCVRIVETLEQVQSVKIKCLNKINKVFEQDVNKMFEQIIKIRLCKIIVSKRDELSKTRYNDEC